MQSGLGGGRGPPRVPGTISSSGRRRDTGRGGTLCGQVRAGEAGGGQAAPRAYSSRAESRPLAPWSHGLARACLPPREAPGCAPTSTAQDDQGRDEVRGGRGPGGQALALYVNIGSAPCSPRLR